MKKYLILLVCAVFAVVSLQSCQPDEEIYHPKCKISKIWYFSNVGAPNEVYNYDEKGNLMNITVDSLETFDFTYNKDKTVSQIVHVGEDYTETIDITYTDRLVDKMVYTVNDTIRQEVSFTRDEETQRITNIEENYDKPFFDSFLYGTKSKLYNKFMGDYAETSAKIKAMPTKDLTLHCTKTIIYAPGEKEKYENIDTIVEVYPSLNQRIVHTYKYDLESFNPFYGLSFAYASYAGYYLNNILQEHQVTYTNGAITKDVTYTYNYTGMHFMNDKHYPRQFTKTSSENNIPRNTYILYLKK